MNIKRENKARKIPIYIYIYIYIYSKLMFDLKR